MSTAHLSAVAGSPTTASTPVHFSTLGLAAPLLKALHDEGYDTPTPIQAQAIPPILDGRDMLGCAQTGTGKTAAFALPILHRLMQTPADKARRGVAHPRALILSPTRELASQIGESFATYGRHTGLRHAIVFGGVSQHHQVKALHRGIDILVATPGRLIDLMEQGLTNFSEIGVFVLDEADRMLDMGFIQPIRRIASVLPKPRQTLLFSATMPKEIVKLAESLLHDPVRVAVTPVASAAPLIEQSVYMVPRIQKPALLEHLLNEAGVERALVFTRTKHGADKLSKRLHRAGITADAIHGNKAQNQRIRALANFRDGRARVLVATDVAARGLDVDGITHVFNYDLPNEPEAYVHRIGRTGRAGATGIAVSFCDGEERDYLRDIEKLTKKKIPVVHKLPELPAPVREEHASHADSRHAASPDATPRPAHAPRSRGHDHAPARDRAHPATPAARPHAHSRPEHPRRDAHPRAGAGHAPRDGRSPHAKHASGGHTSGGHSRPSEKRPGHGVNANQRPAKKAPRRFPKWR